MKASRVQPIESLDAVVDRVQSPQDGALVREAMNPVLTELRADQREQDLRGERGPPGYDPNRR